MGDATSESSQTASEGEGGAADTPTVQLGAFYDPHLLPDFGGPMFELEKAKLVQHNIVDAQGDLVAPWQIYDKLRPGTLVLINAKLFVWHTGETGDRRTYQIIAEKIKVIEESDQPIEHRDIARIEGPSTPSKRNAPSKTDADSAFDKFQSPSKKNRVG
ncbi:hypothetical protein FA13DRAFT_1774984 [Coprinellus micaceus]|uniref:Uncharacterized protein n=1 Tax=Coprinellus micaceus TaxID=71717 RepID=A0A4Y7T7B7_COPMI|nr:hypothetical protein FA13DRAFT_1776076 [Coprinellus micaceus]TEB30076.1 hypothetical protein FA13DRAFT_1774984 [Coprinellus micaceus]